MKEFLIAFAFFGAVSGATVGALSAWLGWPALKPFAVALALATAVTLAVGLASKLDFESTVGALLVAPLAGFLPTGAGFVVAREVVRRRLGRSADLTDKERDG